MFGVDNGGGGGGRSNGSRSDGGTGGGGGARGGAAGVDAPPTTIMHAAYVGALELVKSMVEVGGAADAPDALQGSTPLHWACFGGHLDVVRWLVNTAGADADRANNDGCTPLFFACEKGHLGVAQWLVREAGVKVNVKDNVMWQTPLHRVCLNAHENDENAAELEDLILWLVEAGADLTAVDRFGNHVEDLRAGMVGAGAANAANASLASAGSASKLCDMITTAREDGVSDAETREKLKRRNAVRKKSGSEATVQLSPKLEAKQRAPLSRRGSRKGSGMSGGTQDGGDSNASSRSASSSGLNRTGSYGSTGGDGSRIGLKKKPSGSRVVSKSSPGSSEDAEFFSASPMRPPRGSGGSGGGVAAPAAGAGARMGGGPPAPAVAGGEETTGVGGVAPIGLKRRGSKDRHRLSSSGGTGSTRDDELQQQESLRVAEEALRKTEVKDVGDPATAEARRRLDGAGQEVVDKIRELAAEKKAGEISEQEFADRKRRLLEMEKLRREAEEEAMRREQGQAEDAGAGILTSVGQNTPPPSPKSGGKNGSRGAADSDDDDETPIQILAPTAVKDIRETYKPSDIERYTNAKADGPRVFGEVPESVKESLAAKEAAKAAAAAAAAAAKNGGGGGGGKKSKGKKKGDSTSAKNAGNGSGNAPGGGIGAATSASATGGGSVTVGDMRDDLGDGVNRSSGGCKCVIM